MEEKYHKSWSYDIHLNIRRMTRQQPDGRTLFIRSWSPNRAGWGKRVKTLSSSVSRDYLETSGRFSRGETVSRSGARTGCSWTDSAGRCRAAAAARRSLSGRCTDSGSPVRCPLNPSAWLPSALRNWSVRDLSGKHELPLKTLTIVFLLADIGFPPQLHDTMWTKK